MKLRFFTALLLVICLADLSSAAETAWHTPYIGGGGYWKKRLPIDIENTVDRESAGDAVSFTVGGGKGELPLAGTTDSVLEAGTETDVDGAANGGTFAPATVPVTLSQTTQGSGSWDEGTWEAHDVLVELELAGGGGSSAGGAGGAGGN